MNYRAGIAPPKPWRYWDDLKAIDVRKRMGTSPRKACQRKPTVSADFADRAGGMDDTAYSMRNVGGYGVFPGSIA